MSPEFHFPGQNETEMEREARIAEEAKQVQALETMIKVEGGTVLMQQRKKDPDATDNH